MAVWFYQGKEFIPEDHDHENLVGFVYEITDLENGMKYIGKKMLWKLQKRAPLKGTKRKRITKVPSDWMTYHGSNEKLQERVAAEIEQGFHREILFLCKSKGECSYMEAKTQFDKNVLFDENFYNRFIGCKINASHLKNMEPPT